MTEPVELTTLPNGLRVITSPVPSTATSVYLWLEAGAADEETHESGLAHFLEHMIFKGTTTRAVGESAAAIERLGGDLNAWTSTDETALHATVVRGWASALDVIADMVTHPAFDPDETVREREVVLDEIRGYDDDPDEVLSELLDDALWRDHVYAHRVLGSVETVSRFTHVDARRFLDKHWRPNRAILSVAGQVTHAQVLQAAERAFREWHPGAQRRRLPQATPRTRAELVRVRRGFESTGAQIAWQLPAIGHPDLPALEVLSILLAQGTGGLLSNALQDAEDPGFSAWSDLELRSAGSSLRIGAIPHEGSTAKVLEVLLGVLDRCRRQPDGPGTARARALIRAGFLEATEDVEEIAHDRAWFLARMGDALAAESHQRTLASVTADDIVRVTRTWLREDRAVTGVLDDGTTPKRLRRAVRPAPLILTRAPVDVRVGRGTRVRIMPDDGVMAAVTVLAAGGDRRLPERSAGLGQAWTRTVTAGAGRLDGRGFQDATDALGANLGPSATRHALSIRLSAPGENLLDALDLLGEIVLDPHLEAEDWERVRHEMLDDLRTRNDRPSEVASELARAALWAGHPWRHPSGGTPASLARISPATLRRWHRAHFTGPNTLVVVTGGVDPEIVLRALSWLEDLPEHPVPLAPRDAPVRRIGRHTARAGSQQAHIGLYLPAPPLTLPPRRGLELAAAVLEGQSGRLFMELRERHALAYDVWATHSAGTEGGVFAAGLATRPDRAEEARERLSALLLGLAETPPTQHELDRARAGLHGQVLLSRQTAQGRADALAWSTMLGRPLEPTELEAAWAATSPADVQTSVQQAVAQGFIETLVLPEEDT